MIKIEPLFLTDYAQTRALLRHQPDFIPPEDMCRSGSYLFRGLAFWQHWLPCHWHFAPSVYVAREDGVIIGLISLRSLGKSKDCWQVDHLVVHPEHRGRGVAQELLRYAFALFGSQGVSHFVAEVSDHNSAALSLFGNCGFRRCAKITHFTLELKDQPGAVPASSVPFRVGTPGDKYPLYQLHQDVLPPDIRQVFSYSPEDFAISHSPFDSIEQARHRAKGGKGWYWVHEDTERRVLTCAAKVSAHHEADFHLEFAIHPGWLHLSEEFVKFCVASLKEMSPVASVTAKAFDFETQLLDALKAAGMERSGGFCLLAREHWLRAKKPSKLKEAAHVIPVIPKPAIPLPPMIPERHSLQG